MANKTGLGIGAAVVVLIAAYLGVDLNQQPDAEQKQPSVAEPQHQQSSLTEARDSERQDSRNSDHENPNHQFQNSELGSQNRNGLQVIRRAYESKLSNVQVQSAGTVKAVLRDDNEGSRHQKFILALDNGLSILVAHNIDLSPRIDQLKKGDIVEFYGEYEYSDKGGVIHWTHHDPKKRHVDGWLKHAGKTYK